MSTVGAYEAKTHFSELLRKVEGGETITVTKHGVPVARLVPIRDPLAESAAAIEDWRRYRREHQVNLGGDVTIRELIEDGRR